MWQAEWPWVIGGLAVTMVLPPLVEWTRRKPPGSGRRAIGVGCLVFLSGLIIDGVLALNEVPLVWLVVVVIGCAVLATLPAGMGMTRLRAERRQADALLLRPDTLALGATRLWVRPRRSDREPAKGFGARVDRWLASDGPAPTAGWWHNGGLIVDDHGPALVDAAGLRHGLPGRTAALVLVPAPKSVLLVDERETLLARLPTTGFDEPELRQFATAAGWRYNNAGSNPGRTAPQAVDLRSAVVDRAAKDKRSQTRTRGTPRRDH